MSITRTRAATPSRYLPVRSGEPGLPRPLATIAPMARQNASGRTTAKGTPAASKGTKKGTGKERPAPGSGRYTPPLPKSAKRSPLWVPVAMFTLIGCGMVVIVANYLGLLPGGEAQNSDLILGLALMVGGFVMSTQYR